MSSAKWKLAAWEAGTVLWVAVAGSALHFAFELSDYWRPLALLAAVNESAWEHTKMYFWPGLFAALLQYTYTRGIANNYLLGKSVALLVTPLLIWLTYFTYMGWIVSTGGKASLPTMLSIMMFGIGAGQFASWVILSRPTFEPRLLRYAPAAAGALTLMFASFSYLPPRAFLFENFYCYQYTGEYGILDNYEPYRVFVRATADGGQQSGGGVNYCATLAKNAVVATGAATTPPGQERRAAAD
jgi:hypothetical protein